MRLPSTGLALLLLSAPAVAQPRVDCQKAVSTMEMNFCAEQDLDRADKALNEAYRRALARIDRSDLEPKVRAEWRRGLQEAQRRWIAFRDADCDGVVPFDWYGGTGATVAVLGCKLTKTEARTKELRERSDT